MVGKEGEVVGILELEEGDIRLKEDIDIGGVVGVELLGGFGFEIGSMVEVDSDLLFTLIPHPDSIERK